MTRRLAYRINEAADSLGISRRAIYYLIARGKLKTVMIGGCRRVPASALDALVEKGAPLS
jgi:excisionase family DNA binding protein